MIFQVNAKINSKIPQVRRGTRFSNTSFLKRCGSQRQNMITCQILRMLYTKCPKCFGTTGTCSHKSKSTKWDNLIRRQLLKHSYTSNQNLSNPNKNVVDGVCKLVQANHQDQTLYHLVIYKGYKRFGQTYGENSAAMILPKLEPYSPHILANPYLKENLCIFLM